MKILLLEDDKAIGMGLKYSLEKESYQVIWVETVAEAYKQMEQEASDLYILDLTLPDGNGYDVCKYIKERERIYIK